MKAMLRPAGLLLAIGMTLFMACSTGAKDPTRQKAAWPTPQPLPAPEAMPATARVLLQERMGRHGLDMTELLWSVLRLNHPQTAVLAGALADEPGIARPLDGQTDELNAQLPEAFFDLQDRLRAEAKSLKQAAEQKDDQAMGKSYGKVAETCVACHSLYLRPRSTPPKSPKKK